MSQQFKTVNICCSQLREHLWNHAQVVYQYQSRLQLAYSFAAIYRTKGPLRSTAFARSGRNWHLSPCDPFHGWQFRWMVTASNPSSRIMANGGIHKHQWGGNHLHHAVCRNDTSKLFQFDIHPRNPGYRRCCRSFDSDQVSNPNFLLIRT